MYQGVWKIYGHHQPQADWRMNTSYIKHKTCNGVWNMRSYITCLTYETWNTHFQQSSNLLEDYLVVFVLAHLFHSFAAVVVCVNMRQGTGGSRWSSNCSANLGWRGEMQRKMWVHHLGFGKKWCWKTALDEITYILGKPRGPQDTSVTNEGLGSLGFPILKIVHNPGFWLESWVGVSSNLYLINWCIMLFHELENMNTCDLH